MGHIDIMTIGAQSLLLAGIAAISYFLKRLIAEADALEARVDAMEADTSNKVNDVRERAIYLEAQNRAYDEKLTDLKATLDKVGVDIVWIRERLASRQ